MTGPISSESVARFWKVEAPLAFPLLRDPIGSDRIWAE